MKRLKRTIGGHSLADRRRFLLLLLFLKFLPSGIEIRKLRARSGMIEAFGNNLLVEK